MLQPLMDSYWRIKKNETWLNFSVHSVLVCNFHLQLWIPHIFCALCFPWNSIFTFSVYQLWRQNEPSVPKLPEIQIEGHPVHHIFSHCLQHYTPSLKTWDHTRTEPVMSSEVSNSSFGLEKVRNGMIQTLAAIRNQILLSLQHQGDVAHCHTELHDVAFMVSVVHGFMVLS